MSGCIVCGLTSETNCIPISDTVYIANKIDMHQREHCMGQGEHWSPPCPSPSPCPFGSAMCAVSLTWARLSPFHTVTLWCPVVLAVARVEVWGAFWGVLMSVQTFLSGFIKTVSHLKLLTMGTALTKFIGKISYKNTFCVLWMTFGFFNREMRLRHTSTTPSLFYRWICLSSLKEQPTSISWSFSFCR